METSRQERHHEWRDQWEMFRDEAGFLFQDWILPATLDSFANKEVLECGCGGGHHTRIMAGVAARVTAVDLNTAELARGRMTDFANVEFVDADLTTMELGRQFDVVVCIGVIHHTDNPDRVFEVLLRHCRPGGLIVVWTYSAEGNALVRFGVEPLRKLLFRRLSRSKLAGVSRVVTAMLYPVVHTVYRVPFLKFLPYFEYFANFRRLTFERNVLNVFDKLNAPQTHFTSLATARRWMSSDRLDQGSVSIRPYVGVSYSLVGRLKP
ncbi:conserved hypothetical protein [Magnetospirillum sp. LM-5]|nr:conserved hypothetical protein [Magnetospirillum sp. LM-5]